MKRYLLLPLLLLVLTCTSGCARTKNDTSIDGLFKEFSQAENAEYVNLNPFMMTLAKMATSVADSDAAKVTSKIKSVKVLSLEDSPAETKRRLSQRLADLNTDGYEELIRVNDNGEKVRIFARMDKDSSTIRRLIVLCSDSNDCTLVSIQGKFSKDDINAVVSNTTRNHNGGK